MAFKFIAVLAFVAAASAGIIQPQYQQYQAAPVYQQAAPVYHAAPVVKTIAAPVYAKQVEYEAPAKYDFSYSVEDPHTGDIKSQGESRDGDAVHGSYSLIDADGYKRTVEYTADDHNGFNAVVHREPVSGHKVVAAPVAKIVSAAPVAHYAAAPVAHYAAPIAKVVAPVYSAPAAQYNHGSNYHY